MPPREQRAANANYYRHNRERELKRVSRRQSSRLRFLRWLRERPCADCSRTFAPYQMDFDHRNSDDKSFRLTSGRAMLASFGDVVAEVAKCDVVCANCHRIRTQLRLATTGTPVLKDGGSPYLIRKRRYWRGHSQVLDTLKDVPCADCHGRFKAYAMDFDHRDPTQKEYTVSRMIGRAGLARIMAEVAKCDIVCANCHRARTYVRREASSP